jgi:hypothetical protein
MPLDLTDAEPATGATSSPSARDCWSANQSRSTALPRLRFKQRFIALLTDHCVRKPGAQRATWLKDSAVCIRQSLPAPPSKQFSQRRSTNDRGPGGRAQEQAGILVRYVQR